MWRGLFLLMVAAVTTLLLPAAADVDRDVAPRPLQPPSKQIAISFDDAPRGAGAFMTEDARVERLIAALREAEVSQAAFFVNPARAKRGSRGEARVMAYAAAGHAIGNHTFTHYGASRVPLATFFADVDRAEDWLTGRPGYRPWLRFPFLDAGGMNRERAAAIRKGLAERGLRDAYITVDGSDWNMERLALQAKQDRRPIDLAALRTLYVETHVQSADFADNLARRALGRSPAHVLLLHETDIAALFLVDLVKALRRDGWEIVTADTAYADPIHDAVPDSPTADGTLIERFAWEKHLTAPRWYERNEIPIATRLFNERVLHEASAEQRLAMQ